jgi:hypothetical protein
MQSPPDDNGIAAEDLPGDFQDLLFPYSSDVLSRLRATVQIDRVIFFLWNQGLSGKWPHGANFARRLVSICFQATIRKAISSCY